MRHLKKMMVMLFLLSLFFFVSTKATNIDYPDGYTPYYNHNTATALAKLVWAEGRGIPSDTEKAAIMWCVINRVEHDTGWSDSLFEVITAKGQFAYYESNKVTPELYALAKDVLIRWDMERCGYKDVGRILPINYYYFRGDGERNHFRDSYKGGKIWDWSLPSPYSN